MLKKLCKKGYAKTKKISQKLAELGVVFGKGKGLWANETARVNYQLQRKVNCKDKVASDEILSGIVSELGQEQNENGEQTE